MDVAQVEFKGTMGQRQGSVELLPMVLQYTWWGHAVLNGIDAARNRICHPSRWRLGQICKKIKAMIFPSVLLSRLSPREFDRPISVDENGLIV